jgi:hypothetical protein
MIAELTMLGLSVQTLQLAAFIWMVFEARYLTRMFKDHMQQYHPPHRRATDGCDNAPTV